MDSSATLGQQQAKLVPKQCDTFFLAGKHPTFRRTPSSSTSSSSLSPSSSFLESIYFHDDSLLSPAISPLRFSGRVPFSWEHFPGIPKNIQNCKIQKHQSPPLKLLPLPPPTTTNSKIHEDQTQIRKKNSVQGSFQKDPFIAALVECSKSKEDDGDHEEEENSNSSFWNNSGGAKVSRSLSDRFGFINLYSSCKRTCAVSESLVHLPSSRTRSNNHFTRRSL